MLLKGFPGALGNNSPAMQETWVWSLGWENCLENFPKLHVIKQQI